MGDQVLGGLAGGAVEQRVGLLRREAEPDETVAGDAARFQAVPGIGKRTAERIIVELREKVGATADEPAITISRTDDPRTTARDGLLGLGYNPVEVEGLLAAADGDTAEELLASALRGSRR